MKLEYALDYLRAYQLPLLSDGKAWAPNTPVPSDVRAGLKKHRRSLRRMITQDDIRVCPSPTWHRHEWYHAGQQGYRCAICERLRPWMNVERSA